MAYRPTLYEQETIILFNREEKDAEVYTFEPSLKKKLMQMCEDGDAYMKQENNGIGGMTVIVDKKLVSVRKPRPKSKPLTAEEKKALVDRLSKGSTR